MPGTEAQGFLEARNLLRDLREDYDMACRLFRWPHLDRFNWALDYFDRMAATNDRTDRVAHRNAPWPRSR